MEFKKEDSSSSDVKKMIISHVLRRIWVPNHACFTQKKIVSFVFSKRKNRNHLLENESTKLVAFAYVSKTSHALIITIDGEGRRPIYCFERDKLADNMGDRQINSIVVIRKQRN